MELSLFYNGGHYYEGDIVRIYYWNMGERTVTIGRICFIDAECLIIDYSEEYNSKKQSIDFDEITHIELIRGRL